MLPIGGQRPRSTIGGPVTGGTAGSVLFVDSSGNLGQDNTNFNYDSTTKLLQIGSGATTSAGWQIGYGGASDVAALIPTTNTAAGGMFYLGSTDSFGFKMNSSVYKFLFNNADGLRMLQSYSLIWAGSDPLNNTPDLYASRYAAKQLMISGDGTGATTNAGLVAGYMGTTGNASIWPSSIGGTLDSSNYAFRVQDNTGGNVAVYLQSLGTGSVWLQGGAGVNKVEVSPTAGKGPVITAGTATTDVAALSVTRTNNNAAVATGVQFAFTDTTSAAGFLPFQVLGGASATTNLLSVSKAGVLTTGSTITAGASVQVPSGNEYQWLTRTRLLAPADGTLSVVNSAATVGTGTLLNVVSVDSNTTANLVLKYNNVSTVTIGAANTPVTIAGLTTGTNADTLCLSAGGVILIQAAACTISSLRFKEAVKQYRDGALDIIRKLNPITFKMKNAEKPNADWNYDKQQVGLAAEDVAKAVPLAAIYEQDGTTPKSYRQEALIAVTVKALQELEARLSRVEGRAA